MAQRIHLCHQNWHWVICVGDCEERIGSEPAIDPTITVGKNSFPIIILSYRGEKIVESDDLLVLEGY